MNWLFKILHFNDFIKTNGRKTSERLSFVLVLLLIYFTSLSYMPHLCTLKEGLK